MKIVVDLDKLEGKFMYHIVNDDGETEISGQGRTETEAFKEALEDYYDCFVNIHNYFTE